MKLYLAHMNSVSVTMSVEKRAFHRFPERLSFTFVKHNAKLRHFMCLLFFQTSEAKAIMVFTVFYHLIFIMYKVFTSFFFKGKLSLTGGGFCS